MRGHQYIAISSVEALKSLPYIDWAREESTVGKSGVVKYDQTLAFKGLNIFNSIDSTSNSSSTYLIDMSGHILHTWSLKENEVGVWLSAIMCKNGDLLCGSRVLGKFFKLGFDSNIKWIKDIPIHHDIDIAENKDIYTLTKRVAVVFIHGIPVPILDECAAIFSPDGKIKREISLFKIFKNKINPKDKSQIFKIYSKIIKSGNVIKMIKNRQIKDFIWQEGQEGGDILHVNTLQIINRKIEGLCKRGNLLICVNNLDLIGILDIEKEKLIWSWGPGNLERPHYPTLLKNGNILVFDNGPERGYSRIVELNPLTKDIVWEYKSNPCKKFFSDTQGACQRLPNGNTLITESEKGHIFEVTKDGEIVWEFYNPIINEEGRRGTINRMLRITEPEKYSCLKKIN